MNNFDMNLRDKNVVVNSDNHQFSPFALKKETLEELLSHQELHLLDANTIVENDSEFIGRYRDTQKREIDVATLKNILNDQNTYMSGASLSEAISIISRANPNLFEKMKRILNTDKSRKFINQYDRRAGLASDFASEKTSSGQKNTLDILESAYGNPLLLTNNQKSSLYDEAVETFTNSSSEEERDESIFKYFMAFVLDISGNVDQGDKPNPHNILFDAYNVAMGLTFSYKSTEKGKPQSVYLTTSDGDIESILVGVEDALSEDDEGHFSRPYDLKKNVKTPQEKDLIGYLNESIMNVVVESKNQYEKKAKENFARPA